jgi:cyclic pyranopterin phosphate synthase
MVDVGEKPAVFREAVATGFLKLRRSTVAAIRGGAVPKGDPIKTAESAAMLAAKATPNLLPHCHPIPISLVEPSFLIENEGVRGNVLVRATWKTGVEMEALVATSVGLLTIFDMVKGLEKDGEGQYPVAEVLGLRVLRKQKGHAGHGPAAGPHGARDHL